MLNSLDLPIPPEQTKVVVAMSGGVDSSVVAGLLKKQGYNVIGITLQLYDHAEATHRKGACCAGQDIHDARRVAQRLDIPHYVLNYESRFHDAVIVPFAESYRAGETPVPCIACNQTVKFVDLIKTARQLGADVMATGHYIRSRLIKGRRILLRPVDLTRDQSYFLFATTQEQVDYLRFPLGELSKTQTRALARELGLCVAEKQDSQDICFVPQGKYSQFVARLKPETLQEGDIVHLDGRVLGHHRGVINYTIGQRRGIGVATGAPLYVIALDAVRNRVIVGPRDALSTHKLILRSVNWLGNQPLNTGYREEVYVKIRSTRPPIPAHLSFEQDKMQVFLKEEESGVAPGQACVFYQSLPREDREFSNEQDKKDVPLTRLLGGGWIEKAYLLPEVESALEALGSPSQTADKRRLFAS